MVSRSAVRRSRRSGEPWSWLRSRSEVPSADLDMPVRERVLWRSAPQPSFHDREPVAVCGLRRNCRRTYRLTRKCKPNGHSQVAHRVVSSIGRLAAALRHWWKTPSNCARWMPSAWRSQILRRHSKGGGIRHQCMRRTHLALQGCLERESDPSRGSESRE